MGSKSDYAENATLNNLLSGTVYVGLTTSASDASVTEPTDTAYGRQSATFTVTGSTANNDALISFPYATQDNGVVNMAVFDAATAGNVLYIATVTNGSFTYNTDEKIEVLAGDLTITED
ncbi:hypothetical protein OO185_04260 [Prosthecochloris sp. SCSIO W1102]|uniref:phage tail fiber protein n=1 Tax=Prosthecochloris sp. SCSIO W1102 TaxID=2992243 RepID=UPI00223D2FAC|nr:hypothetical protein [Prosthecochloris sp. SCSIO W1102]UZJ39152.1 hypothetical protein OO185_04260 [Prosthecochloris sp. SCSIO W1102]